MTSNKQNNVDATSRRTLRRIAWGVGYLAVMLAMVFGLFTARSAALRPSSQKANLRQWQVFREAVREQANSGPVARRVPKSEEPPALVLLRDHFNVCLAAGFVFLSLLYGMLAGAISVVGQPTKIHGAPPREELPQ